MHASAVLADCPASHLEQPAVPHMPSHVATHMRDEQRSPLAQSPDSEQLRPSVHRPHSPPQVPFPCGQEYAPESWSPLEVSVRF